MCDGFQLAKFRWEEQPPRPIALFKVIGGFVGMYFDQGTLCWTLDATVLHLTLEDAELEAITAEEAAAIEAGFRAGGRASEKDPVR